MNLKKALLYFVTTVTAFSLPVFVKADIYRDNNIPDEIKTKIEKIVDSPSRLAGIDGFKRKNRSERIKDNISWYKKYGKVNNFYNRYCLDIENFREQKDYITLKEMGRYSAHHGGIKPAKYTWRISNKLVFANIIKKSNPEYLPQVYIKFKGKKILTKQHENTDTLTYIKNLQNGKYFVKPIGGMCGNNTIRIIKKNGRLTFRHVTKGKISAKEFIKITSSGTFLLQEYIENHDDIKKLSPYALNTVRIVTTRFHDRVHILSADMRVSCKSDAIVDNFHKGGAIVHVNTKTGKLSRYAHRMHDRVLKKHPITGIAFENYQLPFWKETIEMVKKLHDIFYQVPSIGWDVAITPTGPKIIEGNCGWDTAVPQTTIGGIRKLWNKLKRI